MAAPFRHATCLTYKMAAASWGLVGAARQWSGTADLRDCCSARLGFCWLMLTLLCCFGFYNATTNQVVAVKKMPKKYRKRLGNILHSEREMLSIALGLKVPRIVKPIATAHAPGGMDCLLLR